MGRASSSTHKKTAGKPHNSGADDDRPRAAILHSLADQSPALIAICDAQGRYLYANQSFAAALGAPLESLIGRLEDEMLQQAGASDALRLGRALDHAELSHQEQEARVGTRLRRFLVSRFPIRDEQRSAVGTGMIATDLSNLPGESAGDGSARHAELLRALEQMERLAYTDRLTGAWNRRHLEDATILEMSRAERHGYPVSLLVVDVDHFKEINDEFGHAVGDYVLVELVRTLRGHIRRSDTITRWGGEEFVVLAADTPLGEAERLAQKICTQIAHAPLSSARPVTVSIGVAEYQCGEGFENWFQRADKAMFRAKAEGRDRVVVDALSAFGNRDTQTLAAPVQLVWRSAYCCGDADIDRQHRDLFEHANRLLQAVISHAPRPQVLDAARLLLEDIATHFEEEERMHAEIGYPGRADHAAEHARLLDKAVRLFDQSSDDELPIAEVFHFLAYEVVAQHLLGADRHYFPYLENLPDGLAAD